MFEENEETIQNQEKENQRGRAWRRSQNKRIENKALKMLKVSDVHYWNMEDMEQRHNLLLERAKRQKNHMKMCSCHMCGNARKWWNEKTMQEKIFKDIENSQD